MKIHFSSHLWIVVVFYLFISNLLDLNECLISVLIFFFLIPKKWCWALSQVLSWYLCICYLKNVYLSHLSFELFFIELKDFFVYSGYTFIRYMIKDIVSSPNIFFQPLLYILLMHIYNTSHQHSFWGIGTRT